MEATEKQLELSPASKKLIQVIGEISLNVVIHEKALQKRSGAFHGVASDVSLRKL